MLFLGDLRFLAVASGIKRGMTVGRDVVPNVPDHFGRIGVRAVGGRTRRKRQKLVPIIVRSRVAKKKSGTPGTASLATKATDALVPAIPDLRDPPQ